MQLRNSRKVEGDDDADDHAADGDGDDNDDDDDDVGSIAVHEKAPVGRGDVDGDCAAQGVKGRPLPCYITRVHAQMCVTRLVLVSYHIISGQANWSCDVAGGHTLRTTLSCSIIVTGWPWLRWSV